MFYVGIISVNPFLIVTPLLTKDFILMVWLCAYLVVGPLCVSEEWEIVEFFSGTGRISRFGAKAGLTCASYEIQLASAPKKKKKNKRHCRSSMDFNGECGFAFLGFAERVLNLFWVLLKILIVRPKKLVHTSGLSKACGDSPVAGGIWTAGGVLGTAVLNRGRN